LQQLADQPVIRNFRELEADLNEFVQSHAYRNLSKNEMSTVLLDLKDIILKHRLKAPAHFFLLARALVTAEGLIHSLDQDLDISKMARPYMLKTVARHYSPVTFTKRVLNSVYEMGMYMEEFPRDIKTAIRKINTGEIKVDLRHKGIDPLIHTINRTGKQIISALIIAALVVSGTLLIVYKVHPWWGTTSAFGIVFYIIAGLIGLGMLRDLRKGDHDDWQGWEDE
jgi:ubiquinone biosynthesis protein